MGQKFTRRIVPRLDKLMEKHENRQVQESLKEIEMKKAMAVQQNHPYTDPNALLGGFRRGAEGSPISQIEVDQRDFLESQHRQATGKNPSSSSNEMPDDLIKFLNDLGPVTREVDSTLTSTRIMKEISKNSDGDDENENNEESYFTMEAKNQREIRRHRLHASRPQFYSAEESDDTTTITTIKSNDRTTIHETEYKNELGLTQDEIKKILLKSSSDKNNDATANSVDANEKENIHRIIRQYIGMPEFMVEENKYVLAVWKDDVSKFEKLGAKLF